MYVTYRYQKINPTFQLNVVIRTDEAWSALEPFYFALRDLSFCITRTSFLHSFPCYTDLYQLLPCISEILLCRKILLSLWQLLKVVIIGQVLINSMPLIISITNGLYTTLCSLRTRNFLPSQKCSQQK